MTHSVLPQVVPGVFLLLGGLGYLLANPASKPRTRGDVIGGIGLVLCGGFMAVTAIFEARPNYFVPGPAYAIVTLGFAAILWGMVADDVEKVRGELARTGSATPPNEALFATVRVATIIAFVFALIMLGLWLLRGGDTYEILAGLSAIGGLQVGIVWLRFHVRIRTVRHWHGVEAARGDAARRC